MSKKNKRKIHASAAVTGSAFVGAFSSRYVDKISEFPFPFDILGLIAAIIFVFFLVYKFLGEFF